MNDRRITPSLVISILALVVALGGVSYAAIKIPKNSVGTKQLRKGAVATSKLKKNSVNAPKIRADSINSSKVKDGTIQAQDLAAGVIPGQTWQASRPGDPVLLDLAAGDLQTIAATPVLEPGSYVISGRANVVGGPAQSTVLCSLESDAAQNFTVAASSVFPLSMAATATLTEPGEIALRCNKSAGTPRIAQAHVIATRVPSIVETPEGT